MSLNQPLRRLSYRAILLLTIGIASVAIASADEPAPQARLENRIVNVPAFEWPRSALLSPETVAALDRQAGDFAQLFGRICPSGEDPIVHRHCLDGHYYPDLIQRLRSRYSVEIRPREIAGVSTEEITPAAGIPPANRRRVLINLHGGGFVQGGRLGGQVESIPIAAVAGMRVISIDYRLAPEHHFPAASEDVAAVYRALLREYTPQDIGLYGCSSGGMLTAEAVAWFERHSLPTPGAIGIFCAGAVPATGTDSARLMLAMVAPPTSPAVARAAPPSYFSAADLHNPLAFPGLDNNLLSRFPPTLVITGSRDHQLSAAIVTHSRLVALGREAELHVWEGMAHAFLFEPDLPESREAYRVIAHFFATHLRP